MFDDDIADMYDEVVAEFGIPIQTATGSPFGIFRKPMEDGELKSVHIDYSVPRLEMATADADQLSAGDEVTVKGVVYTTGRPISNGVGLSVIHLAEMSQPVEEENKGWLEE